MEAWSATCVKQISNVHIVSYKSDALHSQCYVTCATVILGLEVGFVCCVLDMFVKVFGILMPLRQVASSGMKARLLICSQPHSTLCNKTLIGTMVCNADAAAAMCSKNTVLKTLTRSPTLETLAEKGLLNFSSQEGGVLGTLSKRLRSPLQNKDASSGLLQQQVHLT